MLRREDNHVWINIDEVTYFERSDNGGTTIALTCGSYIDVLTPPEQVATNLVSLNA